MPAKNLLLLFAGQGKNSATLPASLVFYIFPAGNFLVRRGSALLRRVFVLCLVLAPLSALAATDWQQPTAAELQMTSYPGAPNAPALYLFRDENVDNGLDLRTVYARVKVLSEKGKEMFADVEIPYDSFDKVTDISGRTIHKDGTVIPFTGKPYDKLLIKEGDVRIMAKVFSLPDVEVGSILEFQYRLNWWGSPHWLIQQDVPVLKAHYHFYPASGAAGLLYSYRLPKDVAPVREKNGSFDLTVENVPALPDEDYLPPLGDFSERLFFYYSTIKTSDEYWKAAGEEWSKDLDKFAHVSGKIRDAVNGIVAPTDSEEQKVEKIYAAMMKLDNTSFTREHTAQENKADHLKIKSAQDIWTQQRGYDDEISWLFLAMVRAAGLKAYGAMVVARDRNLFDPTYMSWDQLDDGLVIVVINGKEVFFDPGQRYCEFGKLHWKHTWAGGIRQTGDGTQLFFVPGPNYQDNSLNRTAQLTLDPDGQVHGLINETMTGAQALHWRQAALRTDEAEIKKQFEDELQSSMPPGVQVKMNHFIGLTDFTLPLMVVVNVSGTLGTETGKHIFLPAVFFEAGNKPMFAEAQREYPVDLHYPYTVRDQFQLTLPANITVESLPKGGEMLFTPNADYVAKFVSQSNGFAYGRLFLVDQTIYKAVDYPSLRGFLQKVSANDQEQVALRVAPEAQASSAATK